MRSVVNSPASADTEDMPATARPRLYLCRRTNRIGVHHLSRSNRHRPTRCSFMAVRHRTRSSQTLKRAIALPAAS